jgi:branched-chain amino acid transport system ATP-binding protein
MTVVLSIRHLTKSFGRIRAVDDVSLELHGGEILGLVGPNGAGKTTLFDLLMGDTSPDAGSVKLNSTEIAAHSTARRCRLGMSRSFQTPRPFPNLTVYESILVAAVHGASRSQRQAVPEAHRVMELTGLTSKQHQEPRALTFLDGKLLELARAIATNPQVLLLDEIGAGLTEPEFERIFHIVKTLSSHGTGIIWIEHALRMMTRCVTRLVVLAQGRILLAGEPADVMTTQELYDVYLGEEG